MRAQVYSQDWLRQAIEPEDRITKAIFLARMGMAVFELYLGVREEDDKDHYANKRLKLAGDLMEDLFREAGRTLGNQQLQQIGDHGEKGHDEFVRDANRLVQQMFVEHVRGAEGHARVSEQPTQPL